MQLALEIAFWSVFIERVYWIVKRALFLRELHQQIIRADSIRKYRNPISQIAKLPQLISPAQQIF